MARKPNYRADRIERDRAKAAKKAKRADARAEKAAKTTNETPESVGAAEGHQSRGDALTPEPPKTDKLDE